VEGVPLVRPLTLGYFVHDAGSRLGQNGFEVLHHEDICDVLAPNMRCACAPRRALPLDLPIRVKAQILVSA
jgi:hypothetical protein